MIAGYGPTPNGQQNDGINIAVPENTPVKAAEDGVVAYAGNELKGYGNLVLMRHPNGYVTAYAHAKELLVKRGDQVKRGQVIAQVRPDRQRQRAATALRNPQGSVAARPDAVPERRMVQGSERDQASGESFCSPIPHSAVRQSDSSCPRDPARTARPPGPSARREWSPIRALRDAFLDGIVLIPKCAT